MKLKSPIIYEPPLEKKLYYVHKMTIIERSDREESYKVCDVSTLKFVVENADQVIISYPMF